MSNNTSIKTRMNHPVDAHVGIRLRSTRKAADITQDEIAKAVGITFQQVQKYEKGRNRISCSKLYEFAKFLNVDISSFFEGLDVEYTFGETEGSSLADGNTMSKKQQIEKIVLLFSQIQDPKIRSSTLNFLESIVSSGRKAKTPKKTVDDNN